MLQDTGSASTTLDEAGCPCAMFGPVRVQPETRCFGEFSLYTHMTLLYSYYFWVVRYFVHFCSLELSAFAHIQSFELQSYVYIYIHIIIRYTQIHIIWHTSYIIDISMMLCINWTADVAPPHTWSQVHCRSGGVGHFSGGQAHRVQCGKESEGVGVGTQTAEESADTNRSTIRRVHTV